MAITSASLPAKKRILTACVRLFLEKGYKGTTVAEIIHEADVSASTFQNIFRAKDGVLVELVEFMFGNQFGVARKIAGKNASPVFVYAVETSIQMTLTELNENLREIYLEAYTHEETMNYIHEHTSEELYHIFSPYLPGYTESDFYELEIGTAGIMRGYMARKCDKYFTLEKKLSRFLERIEQCELTVLPAPAGEAKISEENIAEFYVDDDALEQTVLKLFYREEIS